MVSHTPTIVVCGNTVQDTAMRRHSIASCFTTYLLPHVLFVADFEERQRIAGVCCLAWNIGLFPNAADRERHVEQVLKLILADAATAPAPPGFRQGFRDELLMLVELKRNLFPWQFDMITRAELERTAHNDRLSVDDGQVIERIDLARSPTVAALPIISKVLVQIHRDTQAQRRTLEQARMTPGLIEQVATREMVTAYCVQRADLQGYHRMLATWREASSQPDTTSAMDRFLVAINEVEDDTKAVLGILAAALGAALHA